MGEAGFAPRSASQIELTYILVLGNADAGWSERAVWSERKVVHPILQAVYEELYQSVKVCSTVMWKSFLCN